MKCVCPSLSPLPNVAILYCSCQIDIAVSITKVVSAVVAGFRSFPGEREGGGRDRSIERARNAESEKSPAAGTRDEISLD